MTGGPLAGITVVVTRAEAQAGELKSRIEACGGTALPLPTIEIVDPADGGSALSSALGAIETYDWLVCTSVNAVSRIVGRFEPGPALAVAAIGPGTATALVRAGIHVDLVPPSFVAESLLAVFPDGSGRVLLPRAAVARDVLPEGLRRKGWHVDVVEAYRTAGASVSSEALSAATAADVITFTASSTVHNYVDVAGVDSIPGVVACIGPITAATAREYGFAVDVVAEKHTIAGLVEAITAFFRTR